MVARRSGRRSIESLIDHRDRVFQRLNVSGYMSVRQGLANISLDAFRPVVPLLHSPVSRYQHVQGDKGATAGLTCAQGMEIQPLGAIAGQ